MDEHVMEYMGIQLCIQGMYVEAEPMVMYDNNLTGHPGSEHDFEICHVLCGEQDIIAIVDESLLDNIKEDILNNY